MANFNSVKGGFNPIVGADHTAAGATYAALGSKTAAPTYQLIISSSYNTSVFLSINGTTDHIFIPATSVTHLDFSASKQLVGALALPEGTQFYIKQGPDGAPASGDIYLTQLTGI